MLRSRLVSNARPASSIAWGSKDASSTGISNLRTQNSNATTKHRLKSPAGQTAMWIAKSGQESAKNVEESSRVHSAFAHDRQLSMEARARRSQLRAGTTSGLHATQMTSCLDSSNRSTLPKSFRHARPGSTLAETQTFEQDLEPSRSYVAHGETAPSEQ